MITITEEKSDRDLKSSYSLNSYLEQIKRSIKEANDELETAKSVPKRTFEVSRRITQLTQKIEDLQIKEQQVNKMLTLTVGSWVRNGSTTPGKVVEHVIAGKVLETHVLWWNHTVPVPEPPMQLKPLKDGDMEYLWDGDRVSKLRRRIDHHECDDIDILQSELAKPNLDKEFQGYLVKRIILVEKLDLDNLERTVKQGLDVFYRVGAALAEIRDRKLYKQLGYSDFRTYLKERWDMGKSRAYQLIEAAEVVNDVQKSVHHGGQNLIPQSERVAREVAKAPSELRGEVMQKVVEKNLNPTANDVKEVVAELIESTDNPDSSANNLDSNCPVSQETKKVKPVEPEISAYEVGQLVRINSDRSDERLVGYNQSFAVITTIKYTSFDLKLYDTKFEHVSHNDIQPVDEDEGLTICLSCKPQDYAKSIMLFNSKEEILKAAIAAESLSI